MSKKVAVLIAGSGHRDETEIHEAASTFFVLDRAGTSYTGFSPADRQHLPLPKAGGPREKRWYESTFNYSR